MYYVYILFCRDGTLYTGLTQNFRGRVFGHRRGEVVYTKGRLPVRLIYYSAFETKSVAASFEQYLKTPSGVAFRNKRLV